MALNIKSDEAHRLAKELADATGSSLTEAVTNALRLTLDAEVQTTEPDLLLLEVAEVQHFLAALPDRDPRSADEILGYDDSGLPN
jgi:antitoxin VapB